MLSGKRVQVKVCFDLDIWSKMVCYELEFLFRYWFKVTTHPLLTSPLMWRHGSDGTGEKNIVWTRLFIDVCYDLDLWPRNLILRSHYTLNPKVHFGCYNYQYAYESNLVKGKDYMVLTKILHINSWWPLPLTKKVGQRPLFTIHPKVLIGWSISQTKGEN